MSILFSLRAKGARGLVRRLGSIGSHFGLTAGPMERMLNDYVDLTAAFGVWPTLPITASVLRRHPSIIRQLVDRGVEFAVHGLVHNDHRFLDLDEQQSQLGSALAIFEDAGVPCSGFRAPYLRSNAATCEAVRAARLKYNSSQAVIFPVLPELPAESAAAVAQRRALDFYGALDARQLAVRPRFQSGVVDIPVALPDDEIMVDRLCLSNDTQVALWLALLGFTYYRGDLLTLQLHPERTYECSPALRAVVSQARHFQPDIWLARLEEIAAWWIERNTMRLDVWRLAQDRYRIRLEGGDRATLLVRGAGDANGKRWYGRDEIASGHQLELCSPVKPVVGVSSRSPQAVREFVREEGWPVEVSDDPRACAAHLDFPTGTLDEQKIIASIEASGGPLVRLWRWPSGARSALAVTGDIDSLTVQDFAFRLWETRQTPVS